MKITRVLLATAVASTLISAGCFGGAYTLMSAHDSGQTQLVERELPWDGSNVLVLGVPAVVRYMQAPGPGNLIARGPERSISTLKVSNGHIHDQLLRTGAVLDITIAAESITRFEVGGRSRLIVKDYDQEGLSIVTQGSARVEVVGRVGTATVTMQGSTMVNLSRLTAEHVRGEVGGTATLVASPTVSADLDVRNLSSAVLLTRPPQLRVDLSDAGRLVDAAPSIADASKENAHAR